MMRVLKPTTVVYVLCHAVLIVGGFFFIALGDSTTIWFAVGGSIVAAGISGWVILVYVLTTETVRERLNVLAEFGILDAFDARSVRIRQNYEDRVRRAREKIDILGFGLSALREDFAQEFEKWKQRAQVRILLLDPEFPANNISYAKQRDTEENKPDGTIATDVRQFIRSVRTLVSKGGSFQVRLYRCLPAVNIFRVDDELFWGPYLVGEQSRNTPTFLVQRGGLLFDRFTTHFERIWKTDELSRTIPADWLTDQA